MDDIEDTIDGATVARRDGVGRNLSSSYAGGSSSAYGEASDDAYETVPLRGAGRSLAQRATAHLKALKKSAKEVLKNAFSDSPSGTGSPSRTNTYGNAAYGGGNATVGSPQRAGQLLSRAHARNRSLDLSHVLGTLDATLDGANTAAMLLKEFRESGGDPEADQATNDNLDLELSDVCEAHRAHLTQVAEMTDSSVSLSEEQLNTLLETLEKLNGAIFAIRAERNENAASQGVGTGVVSSPTATGGEQPVSLGTSRIACATTEEEEEAMIAQAIAASLSVQPKEDDATVQAHAPTPEQNGAPPTSVRKQTNEDLLANLIDI